MNSNLTNTQKKRKAKINQLYVVFEKAEPEYSNSI